MIDRLVIFGGTGDLAGRYLLPALAALRTAGCIDFDLVCVDRKEWDDRRFGDWARDQLDRHAGETPPEARQAIVAAARHRRADIRNAVDVAQTVHGDAPVAVYLALATALFPAAIQTLHAAKLPAGSRIVLEKPFGEDLASARELNRLLADLLPEQAIFRVDHFLAMTTVQNLLGSRLSNRVLESIWNSAHIAKVEIVWDETLTLEDHAGYYDGVGALEDMVQNHLLQLLCLVAMEPPISLSERDLRDRKVDVLRSVRPLADADIPARTRRGRYGAGTVGQRAVPSYVDEAGVEPQRRIETFAEIGHDGTTAPNALRFGLDPESLTLALNAVGTSVDTLAPLTLTARIEPPELPAYGTLLLNVLRGDPALSLRADEAEEAWRGLEPVLSGWARDLVPLEEYPAGSLGPPGIDRNR